MATMKDVAVRAGVSTATVSRVLAGDTKVAPRTARRVQDAVDAMGYAPNAVGRALRSRRSLSFGLVVSDIENPFLGAVIRGVSEVAREHGYGVLLFNSDEDRQLEHSQVQTLRESRPSGLIISPVDADLSIDAFLAEDVPVVAIDRPLRHPGADCVLVATRGAAERAVRYLHAQGRRRIAILTGPADVHTAAERHRGWLAGLDAVGLGEECRDLACFTNFKIDGGHAAARELLARPDRPDGLVIANSMLGIGALQAARALGLEVERDFDAVIFDDAPWEGLLDHRFGLVRQPAVDLGRAATRLLLDRLDEEGAGPSRTITLNPTFSFDVDEPREHDGPTA